MYLLTHHKTIESACDFHMERAVTKTLEEAKSIAQKLNPNIKNWTSCFSPILEKGSVKIYISWYEDNKEKDCYYITELTI